MTDKYYLQRFMQSLFGNQEWLNRSLLNPRLGTHGADPWSIDVDIAGHPIIFSFKFQRNELACCINLRVQKSQSDFAARIQQIYGANFGKIGVDISGNGRQAYFKPFGTSNGAKTRDVFFPAGSPPNLNQTVAVDRCHAMPNGGSASLHSAVMLVLKQLGIRPDLPTANAEPPVVVMPPTDRVVEVPATQSPAAKRQKIVQVPYTEMPLVNQIMHFLHDHCTGGKTEHQQKFVTELKGLLEQTTLQKRTPDELWQLMWDKPIYANQNNNVATQVIQRCRQNHAFDDFGNVPHDQPRHVKILDGLRAPDDKLERIRRLAGTVNEIHRLHEAVLQVLSDPAGRHAQNSQADDFDTVRGLIGVPPNSSKQPSIYQVFHSLQGFGGITELHMLVDFGFPVCKPDLWVVRTVIALLQLRNGSMPGLVEFVQQKYPEFNPIGLNQAQLNKKPWYSFRVLDYIVRNELDFEDPFFATHGIDAKVSFRGHRLADLMVAKFGMRPEQRFGLVQSPMDQLNMDSRLHERWPELARLAAALRKQ